MADERFVNYFRKAKAVGHSEEEIKMFLLKKGYSSKTIEEAAVASRIPASLSMTVGPTSPIFFKQPVYHIKLWTVFIAVGVLLSILVIAYFLADKNLNFWNLNDSSKYSSGIDLGNNLSSKDITNTIPQINLSDELASSSTFNNTHRNSNNTNIVNNSVGFSWFGSSGGGSGSSKGSGGGGGGSGGGSPAPTCSDGIQNGAETGVDCGGSCDACPSVNNSAPVLSSIIVGPLCIRTGSVTITSVNASDFDNDSLILRSGTSIGSSNLCNSTSGSGERNCTFTVESYWTDTGNHTIYARIYDGYGNSTERTNSSLNTDNSGPSAPTNLYPANNTATNDTTPYFNWTASTDVGCNGTVSQYNITIYYGASCTTLVQSGLISTNTYTATTLSNGTYYWNVKGKDGFSNEGSTSGCYNITIGNSSSNATCNDSIQNGDEEGVDCGGSCEACSEGFRYLVQNGAGLSDIIVASNATNMVKLAATYFQMYIHNMTNVTLPISNTTNVSKSMHVYIGRSNYTDALGISSTGCHDGGFKIVSGNNSLTLLGDDALFVLSGPTTTNQWDALTGDTWGNDYIDFYQGSNHNGEYNIGRSDGRGSMNAVFEFLYNQGMRWYSPSKFGTVIPAKSNISFVNVSSLINPQFPMRHFYIMRKEFDLLVPYNYPDDYPNQMQWQLSLRSNSYYQYMVGADGGPGHGIVAVIKRPETRAEHPEYYAVLDGVRDYGVPDLCSQGLLAENIRYAKAMFDLYNVSIVGVMPSDGFVGQMSENASPACQAMLIPERDWESDMSNYVWEYVNNIAWAIYNDSNYTGKKILNAAYPPYLLPPTNLSKPVAPNLVVMLTRWRSDFAEPAYNAKYINITTQWENWTTSGEIYTYDYYLYNSPWSAGTQNIPAYFPHIIFNDLKDLKSHNSKGEFIEIYSDWSMEMDPPEAWENSFAATSFNVYMTARAYWDTDQDVDALLEEYYTLYYGPASSQMKTFVEYSESHYNANATELQTMRQMLTDARTTAGNTIYGQRIDSLINLTNS